MIELVFTKKISLIDLKEIFLKIKKMQLSLNLENTYLKIKFTIQVVELFS